VTVDGRIGMSDGSAVPRDERDGSGATISSTSHDVHERNRRVTETRVARRPSRPTRTIVTGGAGFVGSHLVDRLVAEGNQVLVVDDLSSGRAGNLPTEARLEQLDVATDDLETLFLEWHPSAVFHLAAQASVPVSGQAPLRDLAVNVVGTHRVGSAARASGAGRLVFVSSGGAVYGESERPATERTRPAPSSYYGVHKLAAEGHVQLAGIPYAIARPSNVYGPRQSAGLEGAVVAAFIVQALRDGTLLVHGDGSQTRDFIHVADVVEGLWRLSQSDTPVGTWNVATGRRNTVAGLAEIVQRAVGRPLGQARGPRRAGDVTHSAISAAHLRGLGWRPSIGLSAGVASLVRAAMGGEPT
jgi:UDP-glucose 4-epimerase